jgi:hypothetical protein
VAIGAWIIGAGVSFALIDTMTHGEFRRWYGEAPNVLAKFALWLGWPVVLVAFFVGWWGSDS